MLFSFISHCASSRTRAHTDCTTRLTHRLLAALVALVGFNAGAQSLPPEVDALLARAKVPREAFAAVVVDAAPALTGKAMPLLSYRASAAMNPASVMKLVTTYAGLELLGPAFTWRTPVYVDGAIANGVLQGNLIIQGGGDPKLVMERLWLLLRRVQGLGIKRISGDMLRQRKTRATLTAKRCGPTTSCPTRCSSTTSRW